MFKKYLLTLLAVLTLSLSAPIALADTVRKDPSGMLIQQKTVYDVTPLMVVKSPNTYLNKNIKMNATFDKFSTLGLNYKPALRKSDDYIGILIRRDDVKDHVVPLSEMKLFLPVKVAEKYIDLESGDKVSIEGSVFSTALSDPWIDIDKLTVLSSKKTTAKTTPNNK